MFVKSNWIKLGINITWPKEILRICLEKQLLIKFYVLEYLLLLKIHNFAGYKRGLAVMVDKFLDKKFSGDAVTRAK